MYSAPRTDTRVVTSAKSVCRFLSVWENVTNGSLRRSNHRARGAVSEMSYAALQSIYQQLRNLILPVGLRQLRSTARYHSLHLRHQTIRSFLPVSYNVFEYRDYQLIIVRIDTCYSSFNQIIMVTA